MSLQSLKWKQYLQSIKIWQPAQYSNPSTAELWGHVSILQITDFTHRHNQLSNISGCNLSNGVVPPLLAQLTWLCQSGPPQVPCRCLLDVSLCYTPSELPTAARSLYKHRHILQNSRHELGMTPPSEVPGEFNWRPAQILCCSSLSLSILTFKKVKLGCEIIPIHLTDMSLGEGEAVQNTFKFMTPRLPPAHHQPVLSESRTPRGLWLRDSKRWCRGWKPWCGCHKVGDWALMAMGKL